MRLTVWAHAWNFLYEWNSAWPAVAPPKYSNTPPPQLQTQPLSSLPNHCSVTRHTTPAVPSMSPPPRPSVSVNRSLSASWNLLAWSHPEGSTVGRYERVRGGCGEVVVWVCVSVHVRERTTNLSKNGIWSSYYIINVYNSNFTRDGRRALVVRLKRFLNETNTKSRTTPEVWVQRPNLETSNTTAL